jgi:type IV secretory pathway VirB2 component (pilin)
LLEQNENKTMSIFTDTMLDPGFSTLAQAGVETGIGGILRLLRMVSYLLAVASLIIAGIMFGTGRVEAAAYGVVAAGILGLAPSIVNFAFSETDGDMAIPD